LNDLWNNSPYDHEVAKFMSLDSVDEQNKKKVLDEMFSRNPKDTFVLMSFAHLHKEKGEYDEAISWVEKAINEEHISDFKRSHVYELAALMLRSNKTIDVELFKKKYGVEINPNKI